MLLPFRDPYMRVGVSVSIPEHVGVRFIQSPTAYWIGVKPPPSKAMVIVHNDLAHGNSAGTDPPPALRQHAYSVDVRSTMHTNTQFMTDLSPLHATPCSWPFHVHKGQALSDAAPIMVRGMDHWGRYSYRSIRNQPFPQRDITRRELKYNQAGTTRAPCRI